MVARLHHGPDMHLRTVFVVGDPDQAIYGWRGANTENMEKRFVQDFPGCQTAYMTHNYRCGTPPGVDAPL